RKPNADPRRPGTRTTGLPAPATSTWRRSPGATVICRSPAAAGDAPARARVAASAANEVRLPMGRTVGSGPEARPWAIAVLSQGTSKDDGSDAGRRYNPRP